MQNLMNYALEGGREQPVQGAYNRLGRRKALYQRKTLDAHNLLLASPFSPSSPTSLGPLLSFPLPVVVQKTAVCL